MPGRGMEAGKRLHAEVRRGERSAGNVALDRHTVIDCCFVHLELEVKRESGRKGVVPRAQVRRGRRHAHDPAPLHGARTACSTASIEASQGITYEACESAVCGSFRPWPVSTHTTLPDAPYLSSPATDAADAGSQNT